PNMLRRKLFDPSTLDPKRDNKAQPIIYDQSLGQEFQYAGVMNQFFAALTVINITKDEPPKQRPIAQVAPQYVADEEGDRWTNKKLMGQVSVNLTSRPLKLEKGKSTTHSYLLYAGPAKVILLDYEKDVRRTLADHYAYDLHLNTLTDYYSDNWL